MAYEIKNNTGTLFNNDRKQTDNHPDRTGKAVIEGVEYYIAGWLKKDKNGKPRLSLSFTPVGSDRQPAKAEPANASNDEDLF